MWLVFASKLVVFMRHRYVPTLMKMGDERFVRKLKTKVWVKLDDIGWNSTKSDIKERMHNKTLLTIMGNDLREKKENFWTSKERRSGKLDLIPLHDTRIDYILNVERDMAITVDGLIVGFNLTRDSIITLNSPFNSTKIYATRSLPAVGDEQYLAIKAHPRDPDLLAVSTLRPEQIKILNIRTQKCEWGTPYFDRSMGAAVAIDWSPIDFGLVWGTTAGHLMSRRNQIYSEEFNAHSHEVTVVQFSPSGAYMATLGGVDGIVKIWSGYELLLYFQLPITMTSIIAWHPTTPNFLATSTEGRYDTIKLWKLGSEDPLKPVHEMQVTLNRYAISAMSFNPVTAELVLVTQLYDEASDSSDDSFEGESLGKVFIISGDGAIADTCFLIRRGIVTQIIWNREGTMLGAVSRKNFSVVLTNKPIKKRRPTTNTGFSSNLYTLK